MCCISLCNLEQSNFLFTFSILFDAKMWLWEACRFAECSVKKSNKVTIVMVLNVLLKSMWNRFWDELLMWCCAPPISSLLLKRRKCPKNKIGLTRNFLCNSYVQAPLLHSKAECIKHYACPQMCNLLWNNPSTSLWHDPIGVTVFNLFEFKGFQHNTGFNRAFVVIRLTRSEWHQLLLYFGTCHLELQL